MIPVSINAMYPSSRTGRRYKSEAAKIWEQDCLFQLLTVKRPKNKITTLYIEFVFNNMRRNDIDNKIKPTLDMLQKAGFLQDDSQIMELHVYKSFDKEKPEIRIEYIDL